MQVGGGPGHEFLRTQSQHAVSHLLRRIVPLRRALAVHASDERPDDLLSEVHRSMTTGSARILTVGIGQSKAG